MEPTNSTSNNQELISQQIAICLSGGGYRALAYHLGTLSYLDRIDLRKNISTISTISGGSFAGAMYYQSLIEEQPFREFFNQSCQRLEEVNLVELGLKRFSEPLDTYSKRHTIIAAMAATYKDQFFVKPGSEEPYLFSDFFVETLPRISLNATEFQSGIAFRFQNRQGSRIGNGNITIATVTTNPVQTIGAIGNARIADIVAASSCFPGGFEPMAFPGDFVWKSSSDADEIYGKISSEQSEVDIALMDGGIYDNQGAQTLDDAVHASASDTEDLGIFLISDSDQGKTNLYPYPKAVKKAGFFRKRTLQQLRWGLFIVGMLCCFSAITLFYQMWNEFSQDTFELPFDLLLYCIPFLFIVATSFGIWTIHRIVRYEVLPQVPQMGIKSWKYIKKITIGQAVDMTTLRLSSLMAMSSSIFMKRVRGLVYNKIFRRSRYNEKLADSRIYHLRDTENPPSEVEDCPAPSQKLREVSRIAAETPTTLWFEMNGKQLEKIVACGQATLCYNLIKLTEERYGQDLNGYPEEMKPLRIKLLKDWRAFCDKPFFIYEEIREHQDSDKTSSTTQPLA